jgi:hypothetical protein
MSWEDAPLSSLLTDQKEVIDVFIASIIDHAGVNNCSSWRVLNIISNVEESLIYSFVHNYQCYLWLLEWESFLQN